MGLCQGNFPFIVGSSTLILLHFVHALGCKPIIAVYGTCAVKRL